ncbi:MAG: response regulator [Phototrophicaceae bacterium]
MDKRVLYIEDNPQNMRLVRKILHMGGYEIIEAENGLEGVAKALSELPDLILMDINLPDIDGIEATRRIRASDKTHSIPIIALTANAMQGDRERILEAGLNDYLSKPISKNELLEKISSFVDS